MQSRHLLAAGIVATVLPVAAAVAQEIAPVVAAAAAATTSLLRRYAYNFISLLAPLPLRQVALKLVASQASGGKTVGGIRALPESR